MITSTPSLATGAALALEAGGVAAGEPRKSTAPSAGVRLEDAAPTALAAAGARAKASASRSGRTRSAPGAGYATPAKKKATSAKATTSKSKDPLAFLSDPRLSVEEKLFRFMVYVAERYDRQLEDKLKAIAGKQKSSSTSSSTGAAAPKKKKKSGLLGSIARALTAVVPGVGLGLELLQNKGVQGLLKQLSGPVLAAGATALGYPALAPVLLKAGPQLATAAASLAEEWDGGSSAKATGGSTKTSAAPGSKATTSSSGTTSAADPGAPADIRQADMLELQRIQDKQREMFSLVSNLLRSLHDTKMSVIQNLRS